MRLGLGNEFTPLDSSWNSWDSAWEILQKHWEWGDLGMEHELKPLALQWKTWDLGMRNYLNPLILQNTITFLHFGLPIWQVSDLYNLKVINFPIPKYNSLLPKIVFSLKKGGID